MKKPFLAALCSACIIPGMGQIMNQQLKKGLIILGIVFALFLMAVMAIYALLKSALSDASLAHATPQEILQKLTVQDFTVLWVILVIFGVIWIYSVLDAFWTGSRNRESSEEGDQ